MGWEKTLIQGVTYTFMRELAKKGYCYSAQEEMQ